MTTRAHQATNYSEHYYRRLCDLGTLGEGRERGKTFTESFVMHVITSRIHIIYIAITINKPSPFLGKFLTLGCRNAEISTQYHITYQIECVRERIRGTTQHIDQLTQCKS